MLKYMGIRNVLIMLVVVITLPGNAHAIEKLPLSISVKVGRPQFEVDERTDHWLVISNQSSEVITLPNLKFVKIKEEDPDFTFYVKEHVLRIQVKLGADIIPIHQEWQKVPEKPTDFPTVELRPGESISAHFSLTRFYSLINPGAYTVSVTLDTTKVKTPKILKGEFDSEPAKFEIVPVPTFRTRKVAEAKGDYARERITFYLNRVLAHKGEYFPNVKNIIQTEDGIPALIELTESQNQEVRSLAESLLKQIHQPFDDRNDHPALPASLKAWQEWWTKTGSKMSAKDIWSNFNSYLCQ